MTIELSRRHVLASALAIPILGTAACAADSSSPKENTDASVRSTVADSEQRLIALYAATIKAFPALRPRLAALKSQHEDHFLAMTSQQPTTTTPEPVSTNQRAAITALIRAESAAAKERTQSCAAATDTELAWTLALVSASEASHAQFLSLQVLS